MNDLHDVLYDVLCFFRALERPYTAVELFRMLPAHKKYTLENIYYVLSLLKKKGDIHEENGFYALAPSFSFSLPRRTQDLMYDKKWKTLLRWRFLFSLIPHIDFVCVAGSCALQNVHENSDFDVIIGCRTGRIFTVRFFAICIFNMFGIRRTRIDHTTDARNKICLNHFVTLSSYTLAPPYHAQWRYLYRNLIPLIVHNAKSWEAFLDANRSWTKLHNVFLDMRTHETSSHVLKNIFEYIGSGAFGNYFEKIIKKIQIARITRALCTTPCIDPRICYTDHELEFHPDLTKIHELLARYENCTCAFHKKM